MADVTGGIGTRVIKMDNGLNAAELVAKVGPSRYGIILATDELETVARQMWQVVMELKKNPGIYVPPTNGHIPREPE